MSEFSTRGDLASALYDALGITGPTSSGKFGDAGALDGVTSTLADLGITNGVGAGQYGTSAATTRGQAFTMIARALGMADANTSMEDATAALVASGLVKGYNDDPTTLGIDQPLLLTDMQELMKRVAPELGREVDGGGTVGSNLLLRAEDLRKEGKAATDPAYAAFLQQQGISLGRVDQDIKTRQELYDEDSLRRSETYRDAMGQATHGINQNFESRGLFRSGARQMGVARSNEQIGANQEAESYAAQRAKELADEADARYKNDLLLAGGVAEMDADSRAEQQEAEDAY
jgi:hypothetical protein